ncbi:MAG: NAD(P)H-binding protein [Streptomyces sp.]|nr:NAD(P)H-binding protein [Streptomyces sp.]
MKLVVFGANGPTGRRATRQALAAGHTVTAVTRLPQSFPLTGPRLRVTGADVLDPAAVGRAVAGQDAVISTLGAPDSQGPVTVCSEGIRHITRAMAEHGVRRLVCVTSVVLFQEEAPGERLLHRKVLEPLSTRLFGRNGVYDDMRRLEDIVGGSDLDKTIVRPGGLFDSETVSDYQVATARLPGRFTSRVDLRPRRLPGAGVSVHRRRHRRHADHADDRGDRRAGGALVPAVRGPVPIEQGVPARTRAVRRPGDGPSAGRVRTARPRRLPGPAAAERVRLRLWSGTAALRRGTALRRLTAGNAAPGVVRRPAGAFRRRVRGGSLRTGAAPARPQHHRPAREHDP